MKIFLFKKVKNFFFEIIEISFSSKIKTKEIETI
jgi:hypothetical protein